MYFLFGLEKNLETIAVVSRSFLKLPSKEASFKDLKEAYFSFTKYVQPDILYFSSKEEQINFVEGGDLLDQLVNLFLDNNNLIPPKISGYDFKKIYDDMLLKRKFQLIKNSLDAHKKNNLEHYFLVQLLFSYIFLIQSDGLTCATNPKAMGLLLMDHKEWGIGDICEMFIHETAHQLVSLDEYRYGHYLNLLELSKPENYAISAIRKVKRPLNKVIHSLIVAFEIFAYRNSVAKLNMTVEVHPKTSELKEQIIDAIESIVREKHLISLLTPRANLILELIEQKMLSS